MKKNKIIITALAIAFALPSANAFADDLPVKPNNEDRYGPDGIAKPIKKNILDEVVPPQPMPGPDGKFKEDDRPYELKNEDRYGPDGILKPIEKNILDEVKPPEPMPGPDGKYKGFDDEKELGVPIPNGKKDDDVFPVVGPGSENPKFTDADVKKSVKVEKGYKYIPEGYYIVEDLKATRKLIKQAADKNKQMIDSAQFLIDFTPQTIVKVRGKLEKLLKDSKALLKEAEVMIAEYDKAIEKATK